MSSFFLLYQDALSGGALIGLSALILVLGIGRIMGVAGILKRSLTQKKSSWEYSFLGALIIGVWLGSLTGGENLFANAIEHPLVSIVGGILVGSGVTLANGCTSGHGVCGIARLSRRSFIATLIFMASGVVGTTIILSLF